MIDGRGSSNGKGGRRVAAPILIREPNEHLIAATRRKYPRNFTDRPVKGIQMPWRDTKGE